MNSGSLTRPLVPHGALFKRQRALGCVVPAAPPGKARHSRAQAVCVHPRGGHVPRVHRVLEIQHIRFLPHNGQVFAILRGGEGTADLRHFRLAWDSVPQPAPAPHRMVRRLLRVEVEGKVNGVPPSVLVGVLRPLDLPVAGPHPALRGSNLFLLHTPFSGLVRPVVSVCRQQVFREANERVRSLVLPRLRHHQRQLPLLLRDVVAVPHQRRRHTGDRAAHRVARPRIPKALKAVRGVHRRQWRRHRRVRVRAELAYPAPPPHQRRGVLRTRRRRSEVLRVAPPLLVCGGACARAVDGPLGEPHGAARGTWEAALAQLVGALLVAPRRAVGRQERFAEAARERVVPLVLPHLVVARRLPAEGHTLDHNRRQHLAEQLECVAHVRAVVAVHHDPRLLLLRELEHHGMLRFHSHAGHHCVAEAIHNCPRLVAGEHRHHNDVTVREDVHRLLLRRDVVRHKKSNDALFELLSSFLLAEADNHVVGTCVLPAVRPHNASDQRARRAAPVSFLRARHRALGALRHLADTVQHAADNLDGNANETLGET
eukprot:Rhum_TRINITY_DN204_c0_g1::Rhum_TRINITY_DN204_c0_g1_i1::g.678::m.678